MLNETHPVIFKHRALDGVSSLQKKNHEKKIVKLCLQSSYKVQKYFHFDDIDFFFCEIPIFPLKM